VLIQIEALTPGGKVYVLDREQEAAMEINGAGAVVTGAAGGLGGAIARALHACGARLILTDRREMVAERFGGGLRIGIGFNTGPVIAGTLGGAGKLEFTLIGDTVNVAARVEQLTKTTGDAILLTYQTVDAMVTRPSGLTDRGSHALKGKSAAMQVFGLDPRTDAILR
jgi:adenylate cyclase